MPHIKDEPTSLVERWARALGVSKEQLTALVKQVVEERQSPGK